MESSPNYLNLSSDVQQMEQSPTENKMQEKNMQEISSLSTEHVLDLPLISQNHHERNLGFYEVNNFHYPGENIEDVNSSQELNEGYNDLLCSVNSEQCVKEDSPSLRQSDSISTYANCLESSSSSVLYQPEQPETYRPESTSIAVNNSSLPYTCQYCRNSFLQVNELTEHSCEEGSFQVIKTSVISKLNDECNDKKDSADYLIPEIMGSSHLGVEIVETCKLCGLDFQSQSDLSHHVAQEHSSSDEKNGAITCTFCPKVFKNQEQLAKHQARHPFKTSAIECSKCKEVFNHYILLEDHKQYEEYLSCCDICDQVFPNEECMIFHIKNSHNSFDEFMEEEDAEKLSNDNMIEDEGCKQHIMLPNTLYEEPVGNQRTSQTTPANSAVQELSHVQSSSSPKEVTKVAEQPYEKSNENLSFQQEKHCASLTETAISFTQDSAAYERFPLENNVNVVGDNLYNVEEKTLDEDCATIGKEMLDTVYDKPSCHESSVPISSSKHQKVRCQYCSKKCSSRKSLVRHERNHPYGTAAMKCHLCLEVVENYKALKIHKRHEDAQVSCSTCEQILPNENCLLCHVRNVHNSVNVPGPVANDDNSDGNDNSGNSDVYELEEEGSEDDEISTPQYSVSRYTVSDPGAPLRITIKQEKEDVGNRIISPTLSTSTPPTPSTPSPQAAPTPSPPPYVYDSEASDSDNDDDYEPYASDQSFNSRNKKATRRKSSLRTTKKNSDHNLLYLSSSEEGAVDDSPDFNYSPQSYSESEEDSDNDPSWKKTSISSGNTKKRASRKRGPLSDDDSDVDPDWNWVQSSSRSSRKRGRHRKGPLSDDESDNDAEWMQSQNVSVSPKKRVSQKRNPLSDDDSDNDPDWRHAKNSSGVVKKKSTGRRGRQKRIAYAYIIPGFVEAKAKRPRARGCGGQKAQDAAAALAEAVEGMESTVPELKVLIRPLRRGYGGSITKASVKRYNEVVDSEYDYLPDVKSEPKEGHEEQQHQTSSEIVVVEDPIANVGNVPQTGSQASLNDIHDESGIAISGVPHSRSNLEVDGNTWDGQGEQIVIKAEPYDFQEDDHELSQGSDLLSGRKFSDIVSKNENSLSPHHGELDEDPDLKRDIQYICKICGRELQYRSHLLRHLRRVHGGEGVDEVMRRLMKCRYCSKQYTNELSLVHHEKLHDGTNKIKCNKCNEVFDDKNALRRHQRKTHWEHQPVECEICKKQLADNTCLKAHMKHMHAAEEKKVTVFTCETCGRQLHTKTAFQNHVASKCGTNLLFPCETCGKSFSFKGSLKAHQLLHTGVKSFLCKFCGKAFHQKGEMKRHERKHTGEKPFVCEVCGRAFAYRESLLGHSAVHTGIKPFPCKACGMRFSCSGNLVKHRRSNNCKGSAELCDNPMLGSEGENTQASVSGVNESMPTELQVSVTPEIVTKPVIPGCSTNEVNNDRQESVNITLTQISKISQSSATTECQMPVSNMTSVIKTTPLINVKPVSALQSSSKDMKPVTYPEINQSYVISNVSNRMTDHLNPIHDIHDSRSVHNSTTPHNLVGGYGESHFRQPNQVIMNDRRFSQFGMEGYTGRSEEYFDRQSLLRREMNRQVIERAADRQAPKFLDCFGGVQFSGVDSRSTIQSYPAASVSHSTAYPNIHTGHLGNYSSAHNTNHFSNPVNMYGSNAMIPGPVSFPSFTASNHIGVGYTQSSPIPAHSVAHSSSYSSAHISQFEALFGHLSHSSVHSNSRFPSHTNIGTPANPSLPSNNHRV